jgi:hypothetical protein
MELTNKELIEKFVLSCQYMNQGTEKELLIRRSKLKVIHTDRLCIYEIIFKKQKKCEKYDNINAGELRKEILKIIREQIENSL